MDFNHFSHSSLGRPEQVASSSPQVAEAQQLLKRLGYPLEIDGIFGPRTASALTAVWMSLGRKETPGAVDEAVIATLQQVLRSKEKQAPKDGLAPPPVAPPLSLVDSLPAKPSVWKSSTFLVIGALGLAAVGYFLWQESQGGLDGIDEEAAPAPAKKTKSKAQCARTPSDFETGEPVGAELSA